MFHLGKCTCRLTVCHFTVLWSSLLLRNAFTTIPCRNTHFMIISDTFRFEKGLRRFTGKDRITWASGMLRSKTRASDSS